MSFPALVLLLVCLFIPQAEAAVTCTDDSGATISLAAPARRIIALYGAYNEILAGMGLLDRVIARTDADTEPPQLAALPAIGTHMRPNPELVAGLAPDLVLQMEGRKDAGASVAALRALGIPVAVFRVGSFDDLFDTIRRIGIMTGEPGRAEALTQALRSRLDAVAMRIPADTPRPRLMFEVRHPNLLAAGSDSIVDDIITRSGGSNVITAPGRVVRLNEEELLRLDPDVYVYQRGPMNPVPEEPSARAHFAPLKAVRSGHVFMVDERLFSRPGPRSIEAVELLARHLHPSAFSGEDIPQGSTPR